MKIFKAVKMENQKDKLCGVEFTCRACYKVERAILLEIVARDVEANGGHISCYDCYPKGWETMATTLAKEGNTRRKLLKVQL